MLPVWCRGTRSAAIRQRLDEQRALELAEHLRDFFKSGGE